MQQTINIIGLTFEVNGEKVHLQVSPEDSLLDILRRDLELTGTKRGCEEGECGACSVMLDGRVVNSCIVLAVECCGSKVTTIEGLASGGNLHPIQKAFVERGGIQCGFCSPGMIMAAYALLKENASPSEPEVKRALEGNLCRCTGYRKIIEAVRSMTNGDVSHD